MAGWTGKKSNVVFAKPEAPAFLKKFKEKVGYKEDHGMSEKFEKMPKASDDDLEDKDDELPQVVQLNPGDVSQEEYNEMVATKTITTDSDGATNLSEAKIKFRPTSERGSREERSGALSASTKRKKPEAEKASKKSKKPEKSNHKLLSFNEDDDEQE